MKKALTKSAAKKPQKGQGGSQDLKPKARQNRNTEAEKAKKPGAPPKKDKTYYQDLLCAATASMSKSLKTLVEEFRKDDPDFPAHITFIKWRLEDEEFASQYARAKEDQADLLAEEILDISDNDSLDMAFTEDGKPFVNHEHINRSRLRVDSRKWIAAKLKPKKYGDKITNEHTGAGGAPLDLNVTFVSPAPR